MGGVEHANPMAWEDIRSTEDQAEDALERLGMAAPLLGATGWIDSLARLVAADPASGQDFSTLIRDLFAPLGFGLRRVATSPGLEAEALIATRSTGRPVCSIHFRLDPAPPESGWTRPPRRLTRQGHRLYGQGTAGVKGAVAAVWAALRASDAVGLELGFDPLLVFCGSDTGLVRLAARGEINGHVLSLNGAAAPRLWAGCLGSVELEVQLQGQGAPAEIAGPVLERLASLQQAVALRPGILSYQDSGQHSGPRPDLSMAAAEPDPDGGCRLWLNRRYAAAESYAAVVHELEAAVVAACRATPGLSVETRLAQHLPPVVDPDCGPHGPRWRQALGWGFGFPRSGFERRASSAASALGLMQQAGIREILMGGLIRPGLRGPGADECTTVEDVEALARTVLAYLADIPDIPDY
jgi:succinyl-diaminopimelate desuccinylase